MRVRITLEFTDDERDTIGRGDGKPGSARRTDLREFVLAAVDAALA